MLRQLLSPDLPELFAVGSPLVGLPLNTVGPLVVEALVEGLEDAPVPEAKVGLHSGTHLSLVLQPVLLL